ncbi:MalM family protein [Hahella ganghwensis]|uniref:MalM family protein n=1 Tax=Hahella ganghwensis TaxID=286420 RepID=UPI00037F02FE|nr:MalM family protein [Hahella ganghwensis]
MNRLFRLTLALMLILAIPLAQADRYYTWVDENGEVRHTLISDPASEKTVPEKHRDKASEKKEVEVKQVESTDRDKLITADTDQVLLDRDSELEKNRKELPGTDQESAAANNAGPANEALDSGDNAVRSENEAERIASGLADSTSAQDTSSSEVTTEVKGFSSVRRFEGEEYVDAEELEANGFRPAKQQRFYTVIDSDGRFRNIPYPEDAELSTQAQLQPVKPENFQVVAKEQSFINRVPEQADSYATKLLGLESSSREIDVLLDHCCESLETYDRVELDLEEGNLLEINEKDYSHQFGVGSSLLRILELPVVEGELTLELRTYANPRVFYPSVLVLDENFSPQRLLQDIVYVYEPENWFRYGYLEGYLKVDPTQSRYLVIFTTKLDERKRTVVEGIEEKPIIMEHAGKGIIHVSLAGKR